LLNRGLLNRGLLNRGLLNRGLLNRGLLNRGLLNRGLLNRGLLNRGLLNRGLLNHDLPNRERCPGCGRPVCQARRGLRGLAGYAPRAPQTLGMPASQSPGSMTCVLATEFVVAGRIVPGCGSITHFGQLGRGEHLQLPHAVIVSRPTTPGQ
jgi:hypothetical protein